MWQVRVIGNYEIGTDSDVDTYTLRRTGSRISLTIETMTAPTLGIGEIGSWRMRSVRTLTGAIHEEGSSITLDLAAGAEHRVLNCERTTKDLATAGAVRTRSGGNSCGDVGRWVPSTTLPVDVIVCHGGPLDADLVFAPPPGVERIVISADCEHHDGLRVGSPGSIARFRIPPTPDD
jgi:hypothetical protein